MPDKRVHDRKDVDLPVAFQPEGGARQDGACKNLAMGGMYIESPRPQAFGTKLVVFVRFPGAPAESALPAVVRWVKPGGFGVQFGLLGARDTYAIGRMLAS